VKSGPWKRPNSVSASTRRFQDDPYFRDHVPFHEYFHGDTGAGLGAAHQTGWTGQVFVERDVVAKVRVVLEQRVLAQDRAAAVGSAQYQAQTGWTGLIALLLQPRREVAGGPVPAPPEG
jgi:hypothetical protein